MSFTIALNLMVWRMAKDRICFAAGGVHRIFKVKPRLFQLGVICISRDINRGAKILHAAAE